ncbi:MAG: YceI family protein [Pseudomonadota bacterium]
MLVSHTRAILLAALTLPLLANQARAEMADFVLDPEHLSITFFVHHIGYSDLAGMFLEAEGSFRYDEETQQLDDLRVVVQTDSVFTNHERRDGHLRSADFLDVEEFPQMIFEGRSAEPLSDTTGRITGDITLLGVTRPMTLDVTLNKAGRYPFLDQHYALGIDAVGSINRSEFGMSYGVDGGIVGDEIRFVIGLEAIRQE